MNTRLNTVHINLIDHVSNCTTRVQVLDNWGTGFFVAPGLILTCAHVAEKAYEGNTPIVVQWNNAEYPATIEEIVPEPLIRSDMSYPYPDLALLRVELTKHPCVYLHEAIDLDDKLYSYGYPSDYPSGDSASFGYEGPSSNPYMLKLKDAQASPGLSGAPLLNRRTGGVCGIVKKSRDPNSNLGGRAVPTVTILSEFRDLVWLQQQFHQRNLVWIDHLSPEQRQLLGWPQPIPDKDRFPQGRWLHCKGFPTDLVRPLAVDPNDANLLYAGTSDDSTNGIYRSTDKGQSWHRANNGLENHDVNSLTVALDGRVYAGTDNGLFVSTDRGLSWQKQHPRYDGQDIRCIVLSPHDPAWLLCGTGRRGGASIAVGTAITTNNYPSDNVHNGHLHVSTNQGRTWITLPFDTLNAAAVSTRDPDVLYVGTGDNGLYSSCTGILGLEKVETFPGHHIFCLALSPDSNEHVFVGTSNGLYITLDGGKTWRHGDEIGRGQVSSIVFAQSDGNHVYLGSKNGVFESVNGGLNWQAAGDGLSSRWIMSLAVSRDGTVYAGTSGGGVCKKGPDQRSWRVINNGISMSFATSCLCLQNDNSVYAGTSFGVFSSQNGGNSWAPVGDLGGVLISALALPNQRPKPASGNYFLAALNLSTDGGKSWQRINSAASQEGVIYAGGTLGYVYKKKLGNDPWQLVGKLAGDRVRSIVILSETNTIYAGTLGGGVFRSEDAGNTWIPLNEGLQDLNVTSLAISPINDDVVYAGTYKGLYRSPNGGISWSRLEAGLPSEIISSIGLSPVAPDTVYTSLVPNGIYKSLDAGRSWIRINIGPHDLKVQSLAVSAKDSNLLYAGTAVGVYKSTSGGESWQVNDAGLDNNGLADERFVLCLAISPESRDLVYAGMKRGVYKMYDSLH
jgi:photosystem II stability/assembly factor-like uncharacterized protein